MKNILNACSLIFLFFLIVFTIVFLCFDLYEIINLYKDINSGEVFFHSDVALGLYNSIILFSTVATVLAFFIIFLILVNDRQNIVCFIKSFKNTQQNKIIKNENKDTSLIRANFRKSIVFIVISLFLIFVIVFSVIQIHTYIKEAYILKANIDKEGMIFILSNDISNILSKVLFLEISTLIMSCGAFLRLIMKKFQKIN